jgi:mRNA-capping enzyme
LNLKWGIGQIVETYLSVCFLYHCRQLPERKAFLFVNGLQTPFARMRYTPDLRQYDNKIIECSYRDKQWHFHRLRTDKSFPNAKGILLLIDSSPKTLIIYFLLF